MQASSNTGLIAPTSFDASSNRITDTGWGYDPVGNLNQDFGAQATYKFDAENRMVAACSAADGPSTCTNVAAGGRTLYGYDGDGKRVTKQTQDGTLTTYLYDASGQLAAEYGSDTATGTQYLTADQLGSTRVVTDAAKNVVARHDYRPFGDEVTVGSGSVRQGITGYGSDASVMMKFTGQLRDTETGLDFFGARYMSSTQGRFTSPDKPLADQHPEDPQSWNLYSYVRNNPVRYTDPTGNECDVSSSSSQMVSNCVTDPLIGVAKEAANLTVVPAANAVNRTDSQVAGRLDGSYCDNQQETE